MSQYFFAPHYLALTDGSGNDLTAPGTDLKFYGTDAQVCGPNNCPATTPGTNHVMVLLNALPVELTKFSVRQYQDRDAILLWETASEVNTSHFEIERSIDGRNWEQIGIRQAVGNSEQILHYDYIDKAVFDPNTSTRLFYYRLRIIDFDASFEYSTIQYVQFEGAQGTWQLFPNPTVEGVHIRLPSISTNHVELQLFDKLGRLKIQQSLDAQMLEDGYYLDLLNHYLSAGIYVLRIVGDDRVLLNEQLVVEL